MQNAFSESGNSPPTQFYNYIYLREDGTPRYVGKGCNGRAWQSHKGHRPPKNTELILVQDFESEADAFFAEKFLISYYGRIDLGTGCLRNRTDGGENPPSAKGRKASSETREKLSVAKTGHTVSPETREKLRAANLGNKYSAGRIVSSEHRAKISAANLGKTRSPEFKAKISAALRLRKRSPMSPESKAKISASQIKRLAQVKHHDPDSIFKNYTKIETNRG